MGTKLQLPRSFRIVFYPNRLILDFCFKLLAVKCLTSLGATGFEPATSWSRTKIIQFAQTAKTLVNHAILHTVSTFRYSMLMHSMYFRFLFVCANIHLTIFGEAKSRRAA